MGKVTWKEAMQIKKQGYRNTDVYNLDMFFQTTIADMIIALRDDNLGYMPGLTREDIRGYSDRFLKSALKEIKEHTPENKKDTVNLDDECTLWRVILTRIAYCLRKSDPSLYKIKDGDKASQTRAYNNAKKMKDEAFELLSEYFYSLWS